VVKIADSMSFYLVQFLNGLAFSLLLFILAAGLSLIFGMMDVINLAHGSFYMIGAYIGLSVLRFTGSFWLALIIAPLIVAAIGLVLESGFLRQVMKRGHLDQVLLTFGFAYIFMDLAKWIWGADVHSITPPPIFQGSVEILGSMFPKYRLFVIVFGLLVALVLWLIVEKTRLGAIVRAGVDDREMVSGLGIDIDLTFKAVFAVGAALAGLSGVVAGAVLSVYPGMDHDILLLTLIVVVVGGMGTLGGAFWGSIVIGQADTFGKVLFPDYALLFIFGVMAAVLIFRPKGLFAKGGGG